MDCLSTLIHRLDNKYQIYKDTATYLNDRQIIIKHQPVKISDLMKYFEEYSKNTIKKDLSYLRDENIVEVIGKNKGNFI